MIQQIIVTQLFSLQTAYKIHCQQGFWEGRSTIHVIHIMTQLIEKFYEHDMRLQTPFIHFSKRRSILYQEIRNEINIPAKLQYENNNEGSKPGIVINELKSRDIK